MVVAVIAAVAVLVSGSLRGGPGITGLLPNSGALPPMPRQQRPGRTGLPGRAHERRRVRRIPRAWTRGSRAAARLPAEACGHRRLLQFLATNADGTPSLSPCPPFTTWSTQLSPRRIGFIADAIAKIAAATGLKFVDDGASAENPSRSAGRTSPRSTGVVRHPC